MLNMGIPIVFGDILKSDADIICQSVNHLGIMGGGLAGQISRRYPDIMNADGQYSIMCKELSFDLIKRKGYVAWFEIPPKTGIYIASIFGQNDIGVDKRQTDYVSIANGLNTVREFAEVSEKSVAIPYKIGCGLGGGDWSVVKEIIEDCFERSFVDVKFYNYER